MGRAVASLSEERGFEVVAFLGETQVLPTGLTASLLNRAEVAVEFTVPGQAARNIRACLGAGCPVVCGTTGWEAERSVVADEVLAGGGALFWSPNFSIGVHLFTRLVAEAARLAASSEAGFDAHLVETHHKAKLDAPSGTARLLAGAAEKASGRPMPITSVRTGSVPGTHELLFDAPFEHIRLEHVARDRRVFAAGALAAARWILGRRGVFSLDDMLRTV